MSDEEPTYDTSCPQCGGPSRVIEGIYKCRYVSVRAKERQDATIAALRLALETATRERDEARRTVISRDEWCRHAEEQLADVLRLRFLGIEFASQYGDRALACKYDNSCDDSGREPACIPCAFRHALGLMGVN